MQISTFIHKLSLCCQQSHALDYELLGFDGSSDIEHEGVKHFIRHGEAMQGKKDKKIKHLDLVGSNLMQGNGYPIPLKKKKLDVSEIMRNKVLFPSQVANLGNVMNDIKNLS